MKKFPVLKTSIVVMMLAAALLGCRAANVSNGSGSGDYTGFLEGKKVEVAAEVGGQITGVGVQEGDTVQAGQKLAALQDDLIRARITAADANIAAAKAQLALVEAGARPEEVRRAQARLDQARASLAAADQALSDAQAIRQNPQALLIAQAQAEGRATAAAKQLQIAQLGAQAADALNSYWQDLARGLWEGVDITLPGGGTRHFDTPLSRQLFAQEEWNKAGNAAWQAWAGVAQAQANADAANVALKDISDQIANPILVDARVNQARSARDKAAAGVHVAEAALQAVREGASPAQLQAARAGVDQARAARATLDQELAHYQVNSPNPGTVSRVYYRAGETAMPGVPLVQLSLAGDLTLRIFVPMSALETVQIGDALTVRVEGLGRTFKGTVDHINDTAEFSARQTQTDSERNAQLVAVELAIENPDGQLKPGMPATVSLK